MPSKPGWKNVHVRSKGDGMGVMLRQPSTLRRPEAHLCCRCPNMRPQTARGTALPSDCAPGAAWRRDRVASCGDKTNKVKPEHVHECTVGV